MKLRQTDPFPRNARTPRGALLIECMVYLSVWLVVLGIAFTVFRVCQDSYVGLMRNADDITRTLRAGERWREDVRHATSEPRFGSDDQGPYAIVPQADSEVAYRFVNGSVWRFAAPDQAPEEFLARVQTSVMEPDHRTWVTGCRWNLELQPRHKGLNVRPRFVFLATPAIRTDQ